MKTTPKEKIKLSVILSSTTNRRFLTTFWRGVQAAKTGKPITACPYPDHRTARGSVTFSRAWRRYWIDGWRYGKQGETNGRDI